VTPLSLQFGAGLLGLGLGGCGLGCALDGGISQSFPKRTLTSLSVGNVRLLWRGGHVGCGDVGGERLRCGSEELESPDAGSRREVGR
jgi:hypothetical protein